MNILVTQEVSFPELCPSLRSYTLPGSKELKIFYTPTALVEELLAPIFKRGLKLPLVTLKNLTLHYEKNYEFEGFEDDGRITLLVFDNFSHHVHDRKDILGISPVGLAADRGWELFEALLRRSDEIRTRTDADWDADGGFYRR
jgi:hypothetical protein